MKVYLLVQTDVQASGESYWKDIITCRKRAEQTAKKWIEESVSVKAWVQPGSKVLENIVELLHPETKDIYAYCIAYPYVLQEAKELDEKEQNNFILATSEHSVCIHEFNLA